MWVRARQAVPQRLALTAPSFFSFSLPSIHLPINKFDHPHVLFPTLKASSKFAMINVVRDSVSGINTRSQLWRRRLDCSFWTNLTLLLV